MVAKKKYEVFISYSHEDAGRIAPIIKLVGVMKDDLVFQDAQNIKPGKPWEPQLRDALDQAKIIIVFWCTHSEKSEYVRKEYEAAIKSGKDVLPLLLDDTELPEALSAYQWIDLRGAQFHTPWQRFVGKIGGKSGPHFYPKDKHGEYVDWESRWEAEDYLRREKAMQERMAKSIVEGVTSLIDGS